jgi:hypothetical protein
MVVRAIAASSLVSRPISEPELLLEHFFLVVEMKSS